MKNPRANLRSGLSIAGWKFQKLKWNSPSPQQPIVITYSTTDREIIISGVMSVSSLFSDTVFSVFFFSSFSYLPWLVLKLFPLFLLSITLFSLILITLASSCQILRKSVSSSFLLPYIFSLSLLLILWSTAPGADRHYPRRKSEEAIDRWFTVRSLSNFVHLHRLWQHLHL